MIRKTDSWLTRLLCVSLCVALLTGAFPLSAAAVSQSEIDALRVKRDEIQARRVEKQAFVDELKNSAVGILVQKRALDERNMYTIQQIQLNNEEIALYDQMISEKEQEVLHAQELEKEQLERYRSRVRAMEENGNLNYLALILKANDLGEMLTAMDDVGEIMQRDRELEDEYIRARENTEEVKAEYESYRAEINGKQEVLRVEQEALQAEIDEADELLLSLHEDYLNRQAEIAEIQREEDETNASLNALVAASSRPSAPPRRRPRLRPRVPRAAGTPGAQAAPRPRSTPRVTSSSRSPHMRTSPAALASASTPSPGKRNTTTVWTSPQTPAPRSSPPTAARSCWLSGTAATATVS